MLIKIDINLKTLEAVCEDSTVTINEVSTDNGHLLIEISKKDPETSILQPTVEQKWQL